MKRFMISFISLCSLLFVQAADKTVPDLHTLKKGDWFELECTKYLYTTDNLNTCRHPWDHGLKKQIFFKVRVLKKDKHDLTLSLKMNRVLEKSSGGDCINYFDSHYPMNIANNEENTSINESDSLVLIIDLKKHQLHTPSYFLNNEQIEYKLQLFCRGFKNMLPGVSGYSLPTIDVKETYNNTAITFLRVWLKNYKAQEKTESAVPVNIENDTLIFEKTGQKDNTIHYHATNNESFFSTASNSTMPLIIKNRKKERLWNEIRVTNASFTLTPNVNIICHIDNSNEQNLLEIITSEGRYVQPQIFNKGSVQHFSFFLPNPDICKLHLHSESSSMPVDLSITPGDSVAIDLNKNLFPAQVYFSGKNSANYNCLYELSWDQSRFKSFSKSLEEIKCKPIKTKGKISGIYWDSDTEYINSFNYERYETKREEYLLLLKNRKPNMTRYWQKSLLLDVHYWCATHRLKVINSSFFNLGETNIGLDIPNDNISFNQLTPMLDYLVETNYYHSFLIEYKNYQENSILNKYNFTANSDKYNLEEKLFLNHLIFRGYPKYYTSTKVLYDHIQKDPLAEVKKTYDDFMEECNDPQMLNRLENIYTQIEQIQPGRSLKNLNLKLNKHIKFKEKADGFILLYMSKHDPSKRQQSNIGQIESSTFLKFVPFIDIQKSDIKQTDSLFASLGLKDKVEIIIFRSEEQKRIWDKKVEKYKGKVSIYSLNQNDFYKDLNRLKIEWTRYILLRNDGTIIHNNVQHLSTIQLQKIIEEDMNKPETNNQADTRRLGMAILLTLLFSGFATWGIVKIRTRQIHKKEAAKRRLAELELKAIRSQMNPHFLFNALSSIQHLINKNQIEAANLYLSQFAEMMRLVLNNSEKTLVPLADELELLKNYLQLEKLRVPFEFNISIGNDLYIEEEEIPGMLIQPFVENAVIHGITPQRKGYIDIRFTKSNHYISCHITDDGIGISNRSKHQNGNGKAIKMVQERINIVNSQTEHPLSVQLIDRNEMGEVSGTLVKIEIPV